MTKPVGVRNKESDGFLLLTPECRLRRASGSAQDLTQGGGPWGFTLWSYLRRIGIMAEPVRPVHPGIA